MYRGSVGVVGVVTSVLAVVLALPVAHAEVLCVRTKKDGTLSGSLKVRTACRKREVPVDPARLGLCCQPATTTTSTTTNGVTTSVPASTIVTTTSLTCPTITTTTLGINVCGGNPPTCFGLCANARACVGDGIACSCTGPVLPCGVVTSGGACGGECPAGMACMQTVVIGGGGCPESVTCACVAP